MGQTITIEEFLLLHRAPLAQLSKKLFMHYQKNRSRFDSDVLSVWVYSSVKLRNLSYSIRKYSFEKFCCKGEGIHLVEAIVDIAIDDIADFTPGEDLAVHIPQLNSFTPASEDATPDDIFSFPLYMSQVTLFRCGGVCVGVVAQHNVADCLAEVNFTNTWTYIARGLNKLWMLPVIDITAFKARKPLQPQFQHAEYVGVATMFQKHPFILGLVKWHELSKFFHLVPFIPLFELDPAATTISSSFNT